MFLSDNLFLINSVDPHEMPHYAALLLGLPFLPKYSFRVSSIQRVNTEISVFRVTGLKFLGRVGTHFFSQKNI